MIKVEIFNKKGKLIDTVIKETFEEANSLVGWLICAEWHLYGYKYDFNYTEVKQCK
jgi:hypothetical protein